MLKFLRRLFQKITAPKTPPHIPFRCGTMLLWAKDAEARARIHRAWDEGDDEYIAWVEAHPSPKREWLETAEHLRKLRHSEPDPPGARVEDLFKDR